MNTNKKFFYSLHIGILFFACTLVCTHAAQAEEDRSADLSIAVLSDYIWRGQELSKDSIVIQPSLTATYSGLSFNMWSNLDTDPYTATPGFDASSSLNETDLSLSYEKEISKIALTAGYVYYGLDAFDDSQEFFISTSIDTFLSPSLTVYREISNYQSWYLLLGASHSFEITNDITFDLSGSISYLRSLDAAAYPEIDDSGASTGKEFKNLHDGVISAALPIKILNDISITPTLAYTFPLCDDARNEMKWRSKTGKDDQFIYGGIVLNVSL